MEPFVVHTGRPVPLRRENVDTDQIIPAQFLTSVDRSGFGAGLFARWREDGDFVLDQPGYAGATILVAGSDFGTGSSREHAVWALQEHGLRAVISPSFADIFQSNALKNGLLPVELEEQDVETIMRVAEDPSRPEITIDLVSREVIAPGLTARFAISDDDRHRLLEGLDAVTHTLTLTSEIADFEQLRPAWLPRVSARR